jgi:hypothetical protein
LFAVRVDDLDGLAFLDFDGHPTACRDCVKYACLGGRVVLHDWLCRDTLLLLVGTPCI